MFSTARDKDTLAFGARVEYPMFHWWRATRRREQLKGLLEQLDALVKETASRDEVRAAVSEELEAVNQRITDIEKAIPDAASITTQSIRDWAKVIPLKLIESASIFDEEANRIWFADQFLPSADQSRDAPR